MDINELTIDQNLLERINPVFNTAKMTLFQLSAAGDRDAVRIGKARADPGKHQPGIHSGRNDR